MDAAIGALEEAPEWTTAEIEGALKTALLDGLELKPRKAFGPIRVAVTGSTVSPAVRVSGVVGPGSEPAALARCASCAKHLIVCSTAFVPIGVWCNWQHS